MLDWADAHPDKAAAIAAQSQEFARAHLTAAAARQALRAALVTTAESGSAALVKAAAWRATMTAAAGEGGCVAAVLPSFIESSFTTKVAYEEWCKLRVA